MYFFYAVLRRETLLLARHRQDWINPLAFFLVVTVLFPLAISPESKTLAVIAPGVVWIAALLATLLSLDGLFKADFEDGSLEQMLISGRSLWPVIYGKLLVHWLATGFLLALLAPLLSVVLFLPGQAMVCLVISLLLGTPTLIVIGAIGAALTVGLRRGGVLITLLVLPLYIPVLIFGAASVQAAAQGMAYSGQLALLSAIFLLSLLLAPVAIGAALKVSVRG